MKSLGILALLSILTLVHPTGAAAERVDTSIAGTVAQHFVKAHNDILEIKAAGRDVAAAEADLFSVGTIRTLFDDLTAEPLAHIVDLKPKGFMAPVSITGAGG